MVQAPELNQIAIAVSAKHPEPFTTIKFVNEEARQALKRKRFPDAGAEVRKRPPPEKEGCTFTMKTGNVKSYERMDTADKQRWRGFDLTVVAEFQAREKALRKLSETTSLEKVPRQLTGKFIGKGGGHIRTLSDRTKTTIKLVPETNKVSVKGAAEDVQAAIDYIRKFVDRGCDLWPSKGKGKKGK